MDKKCAERDSLTAPTFRSFPLITNGEMPEIDLLAIVVQCVEEMEDRERFAALGYLNARFPAF